MAASHRQGVQTETSTAEPKADLAGRHKKTKIFITSSTLNRCTGSEVTHESKLTTGTRLIIPPTLKQDTDESRNPDAIKIPGIDPPLVHAPLP